MLDGTLPRPGLRVARSDGTCVPRDRSTPMLVLDRAPLVERAAHRVLARGPGAGTGEPCGSRRWP